MQIPILLYSFRLIENIDDGQMVYTTEHAVENPAVAFIERGPVKNICLK